jgi:hypothetical protein
MTKDERLKMYADFLKGEGYSPETIKEGVVFKAEGKTYVIMVDENDEQFFRLVFPNFWSIDSDKERVKVVAASSHSTAATKVAKIFPVDNNTWGTIELFVASPDHFKGVFTRSLGALQAAVQTFVGQMKG